MKPHVLYVLPSIRNSLSAHSPVALSFSTTAEKWLSIAVVKLRSFRMTFHEQVIVANLSPSLHKTLAHAVTRWAPAEYLFKTIPLRTTSLEVIFPSSVSLSRVKTHLNSLLAERSVQKTQMFVWTVIVMPTSLLISKFVVPGVASVAFCYLAFRVSSAWRAYTMGNRVQLMLDQGRVTFTQSQELQSLIERAAKDVSLELEQQQQQQQQQQLLQISNINKASMQNNVGNVSDSADGYSNNLNIKSQSSGMHSAENRSPTKPNVAATKSVHTLKNTWKWDGKGDLHDLVIRRLEKELKVPEWVRAYRRARLMYFVHKKQ